MTKTIPSSHRDLLEEPIVVTLTTISAENEPYSVAVWRRWDGEYLRITSDAGKRKHRNILANPHVALLVLDPDNPQRYLSIGGVVTEIVNEKADVVAELDRQTSMYTGKPHYFGAFEPLEAQATFDGVIIKIRPTRIVTLG